MCIRGILGSGPCTPGTGLPYIYVEGAGVDAGYLMISAGCIP